jgi:hypothetical protein
VNSSSRWIRPNCLQAAIWALLVVIRLEILVACRSLRREEVAVSRFFLVCGFFFLELFVGKPSREERTFP